MKTKTATSKADVAGHQGESWLYTNIVKNHFFHPRNIFHTDKEAERYEKTADGIGQVGSPQCGDVMKLYIKIDKKKNIIKECRWKTFGCCQEGELISTPEGFVPIEKIRIGDKVINHTGEETIVEENSNRKFNGIIYTITPLVSKFNTLSLTEEHPILAIRRKDLKYSRKQTHTPYLRVDYDILTKTNPEFTLVKYLDKGDFLVYPSLSIIKDNPEIREQELKLLGFYLSEGYFCAEEKCSGQYGVVAFAFHKNEIEYLNELKKLLKETFDKNPSERTRGNVTEVYICSRKAIRFFEKYCGHMAKNKTINAELMYLPLNKQEIFLDYYFKGDGHFFKDKRINRQDQYIMTTASQQLALRLQQLIVRLGFFANISKRRTVPSRIDGRLIESKDSYVISYIKDPKKRSFTKKTKGYFLVPIGEINKNKYSGKVYNLQVMGENKSYLVRGFAVHNCASAIASTSIMSEMAIGKTLEEAKKITPQDIVKALGGLPTRKIHCSVLGDQALRAAIEDYEKKRKR